MGKFPCPRCKIAKTSIPSLGTKSDTKQRSALSRRDDLEYRSKISGARDIIYRQRYTVNSEAVETILKEESLSPAFVRKPPFTSPAKKLTSYQNAFSISLSQYDFDFFRMMRVDFLHEVELGLFKMVFTHLIRILQSIGDDRIRELNWRYVSASCSPNETLLIHVRRYSQVPSFGSSDSAIRNFPNNVSDMKKLAARDFEDLLQVSYSQLAV